MVAVVGGHSPRDRYVSAAGSDNNPGTASAPWATLTKVNAASLSANAIVYFRGGDTFYGQLTNSSSGTSGHSITYKSYGSGRATLSGGALVATWTQVDVPKNIWRASFSAASGRPRAVWVNNKRCSRSRTTSLGSMTTTSTGWNSTLLASAAFPAEVEFHMLFAFWSVKYVQVTAATGTTITIDPTVKTLMNTEEALFNGAGGSNVPYEAENIYEVFVSNATAGTFFQDRTNNYIYLIPPSGVSDPNSATVVAGVRENVISLSSVHDVTIGNLAVRHTTSLRPYHANAYIDGQTGGCIGTDFQLVSVPGGTNWVGPLSTVEAALKLDTCTRVSMSRTLVCGTGGIGVKVSGGSSTVELDGVIVRDTGGANIQIGEPGYVYTQLQTTPVSPQLSQPTLTSIHDSIFHGAGVDFISQPNIIHWYGDTQTIRYNTFRDSNYSNMAMGWGFGYYEANTEGGDLIEYNEVFNGMGKLDDGGGIYLNGVNETTRTVQYNYVHDITGTSATSIGKAGLYLDGGAYRNSVQNNVTANIQIYSWNLNSDDNGSSKDVPRSAPRNIVANNTMDSSSTRTDGSGGQNTTSPNTTVSNSAAIAAGVALGTGPRASYSDVIAEDAALVIS